jgi:sugar phosphate isomerase/epimerase
MRFAFSTLACPGWSWEQAIRAAQLYGYHGIEWRMIDGSLVSAEFSAATCRRIRSAMREAGVQSCALDSSAQLAVAPGEARDKVVAECRGMLRLAGELGAGMLRVFIGTYPRQTPNDTAIEWVVDVLSAFLPEAERQGAKVALEIHSFEGRGLNVNGTSDSSLCRRVVSEVGSPALGILWDVGNPFEEGETVEQTWANVRDALLYLHVKDAKLQPDGSLKYVLNGEGDLPLREVISLVTEAGFDGWLSYEWEKKWKPDLAEPEVALPHYIASMRALTRTGGTPS